MTRHINFWATALYMLHMSIDDDDSDIRDASAIEILQTSDKFMARFSPALSLITGARLSVQLQQLYAYPTSPCLPNNIADLPGIRK